MFKIFIRIIIGTFYIYPMASNSFIGSQKVILGGDSIHSIAFDISGRICQTLNLGQKNPVKYPCFLQATDGSDANLYNMLEGNIDFALSSQAIADKVFQNSMIARVEPVYFLRAIFPVYQAQVVIIAQSHLEAETLKDLRGKRISIGPQGSDSNIIFRALMQGENWSFEDRQKVFIQNANTVQHAFCQQKVDALVFFTANPDPTIAQILKSCPGKIISLSKKEYESLKKYYPSFTYETKNFSYYPRGPQKFDTASDHIVLYTTSSSPFSFVYTLMETMHAGLKKFKKAHPALKDFTLKDPKYRNRIPYHEGVIEYLARKTK